MNCEQTINLLDAYLDNELDPASYATVAAHLTTCPGCAGLQQQRQQLGNALRNPALYHKAPASLRAQLQQQLKTVQAKRRFTMPIGWMSIAASWAVVAVLTWSVALYQIEQQAQNTQTSEVFASHVRSLLVDHAVDIASSDQHNVKPWFNGRVDYSPTVPDLSSQGFTLLGGRLDYVDNKTVPVLIYQRRQHLINVFMRAKVPTSATTATNADYHTATQQGYNLIQWQVNGVDYWAVSDLNIKELEEFSRLLTGS
jgi:anti-sigma factor RsiW